MSSLMNGFFSGSKYSTKTNKQKLETRIKDSVFNLIIDRDYSFLKTLKENKTSILVNNRDGGIQEFEANNRKYISIPSSMEEKLSEMPYSEAEIYLDDILKLATSESKYNQEEKDMKLFEDSKKEVYEDNTSNELVLSEYVYEYRKPKDENENDKDIQDGELESGSCLSKKGMSKESSGESECDISQESENKREYSFEDTDLNPDGDLSSEVQKDVFYANELDYPMSESRETHLRQLAQTILKSFEGRVSKQKTIVPSKKLVSKSLVLDTYEKIYQNKKGDNGKELNINLIIDMSGSMIGEPVCNARDLIYIFNEIALAGKLKGNVIYSATKKRSKVSFPMPRELIKHMVETHGAEGLGKNLENQIDELKKADQNICITDGQLRDDPILLDFYSKKNIDIIGVYVNKDAEDLTEYTGSLDRWFSRSLVRRTVDELCQKIVSLGLRKKGK